MNILLRGLRASAALFVLLIASNAKGAAIAIDDTLPNDMIRLTVNDFEGGFSVNGNLLQQGLGNPQSILLSEATPFTFSGSWIDLGQSTPGHRTIFLVEASDPTLISDILDFEIVTNNGFGTITGSFVSDVNGNLGSLPAGVDPANVFVENGRPVSFGAAFLGGVILSDVDVPEPGTVSLALLAMGSLCLRPRRGHA